MHIAMLGQKGVPGRFGGVETHVTELSTRLVRSGHTVTAYSRTWYAQDGGDRYNGIRIIRLPSIRTKHLDAISHTLFAVFHAVTILRPDVYHFHGVGPSLLAWIPRILAPHATVVSTFHCIDRYHEKWGRIARFALKIGEWASVHFADETIAVSKIIAGYTADAYGKASTYIPNGITPRRVSTDPLLVEPFGLQTFSYVAMVSRLVKHKGAHTLIAAWQRARELRPELFRDLKLAIIGGSAFTDQYVKSLHGLAAGDSSIVFTGYQSGDALEALFAGARFVVHPSTSEGLPIAILEAMSYGKAVLAADIPENMEVIAEHGMPFSAGDVEDLAHKMVDLLQDPMYAASLGHLARAYVENMYHWDDIAHETVEVYRGPVVMDKGAFAQAGN